MRKTPLLTRAAVAALLLCGACSSAPGKTEDEAGGKPGRGAGGGGGAITLSASDVMTVQRGALAEGVRVTGDLRPLETVAIRARIEGDLLQVNVREGQPVRAGEVLARFDDTDQIGAAESGQADVAAAKTSVATAQWSLEQARELYKQGAVPEQELRAAEQTKAAAEAQLAAAESRLLTVQRARRDTRVLAPVSGVIEKRETDPGEHIAKGQELFTLVRGETLELAAAVPANQANGIVPGQEVRFIADGMPFQGRVARVSPTVDPATRSVTVYVQVPNASGAIKGGTMATGRIIRRVIQDALTVPTSALRQSARDGSSFVYKIVGQQVAEAPVSVGAVDEEKELAQVQSGLQEGDRVIVGNVGLLGRGMKVQIIGGDRAGSIGERGSAADGPDAASVPAAPAPGGARGAAKTRPGGPTGARAVPAGGAGVVAGRAVDASGAQRAPGN